MHIHYTLTYFHGKIMYMRSIGTIEMRGRCHKKLKNVMTYEMNSENKENHLNQLCYVCLRLPNYT